MASSPARCSARVSVREYREAVKRLDALILNGHTSEAAYRSTRAALLRYEADVLAAEARLQRLLKQPVALEIAEAEARVATAQANLEASRAELEHYTVTAPIDGVVSWLDVHPGTVSRPGTTVWGEILDLSELEFISSLMIGVLSDFHRGIIRTGGRVHLTAVKEPVREALQRSGLLSPPGVPEAA